MSIKVLMVLDSVFPPDERVEKEATSLINHGFEVHIACMKTRDDNGQEQSYKGINIWTLDIAQYWKKKLEPFQAKIPIYSWIWTRSIKRIIYKTQPDIIHCHDLPMAAVGFRLKKSFPKLKFVADQHENYPSLITQKNYMREGLLQYLFSIKDWYKCEKRWLSNADLIIVTASGMKERLQRVFDRPKKVCIVENMPRISDLEQTINENTKPDSDWITICYTGYINYHRGLQIALKGYAIAKKTIANLRFWVIGSGSYEDKLKSIIDDNEIADVTFYGFQPHSTMFPIVQKSDIALIPHLKYEHTDNTSPNKIFHYWYFKKPILSSNCTYLVEKIDLSNGGLYYQFDDHEDFSKKLIELIESDKMKQIGNNGYKMVVNYWNWESASKTLVDAYKAL